jgi:hypothetical protein
MNWLILDKKKKKGGAELISFTTVLASLQTKHKKKPTSLQNCTAYNAPTSSAKLESATISIVIHFVPKIKPYQSLTTMPKPTHPFVTLTYASQLHL